VQSFTLRDAKSVRFVSQTSSIAGTGAQDVYVKNGDLFYARGGTDVQITNGGSIAGASGSIAGLVSPASAVFSGQQFNFFYDAGTYADLRCRDLTLSTNGGNTLKLTQSATASYTLTLPPSPPSTGNQLMAMDSVGVMSTPANPTLGAAASVLTWQGSTQSTAIGNGSVVIAGGVSVAKTLRVGQGVRVVSGGLEVDAGGMNISGLAEFNGNTFTTGTVTAQDGLITGNVALSQAFYYTNMSPIGRLLFNFPIGGEIYSVDAFILSESYWKSIPSLAQEPGAELGSLLFLDATIFTLYAHASYANASVKLLITYGAAG
jgi:hypothetical protein